ncbi:MAG: hypothetical protein RL008_801 [Actinomycetota bacterium]|jgi:hypothetical protein
MALTTDLSFEYKRFPNRKLGDETYIPRFPRGDSIEIVGRFIGENVATMAVDATVVPVINGQSGPPVVTRETGDAEVVITSLNPAVKEIYLMLCKPTDTAGFEPGQIFKFDIQITVPNKKSGAPNVTTSILGQFFISEDQSLTVSSPVAIPTPTPTP